MKCLVLLMMLFLTGCARPLQRFEFTRLCMGVQTRIAAFAPEKTGAETAAAAAFERIDQLDGIMSDYRRGSELNRLSDAAGGDAVPVSEDLFDILLTSQDIALASGGAFDITVGPAVALWREARTSHHLPDPDQTARALSLIGWDRLELKRAGRTARLRSRGMRLDLGGIAKGYAAEQGVRSLRAYGLPRCLVSLAGDVFAGDAPPGERGWRIEVRGEQGGDPTGTLLIANGAVSTSGDTEQVIEIDGHRYSHIINPATGLGIQDRRSVTVVAPRGAWADALATPACILGPAASIAMFESFPGTGAVFEEWTPDGPRHSTWDPHHLLNWEPGARSIDLSAQTDRRIIVDREPGQYLGHVSTVLLGDGSILAVYPKGHGKGPIVMKRSTDGGRTWSPRLPVPDNWSTSVECPSIHRLIDLVSHRPGLVLFSGLYPARIAHSDDEGATWSPLEALGDWGGIVVMGSVEQLSSGEAIAVFHDDGRFFTAQGKPGPFTLYKTISRDTSRTWSAPAPIYSDPALDLCEPGLVRSPDGRQLAMLLRENRRTGPSYIMFSNDQGATWSRPHPLPLALCGDRHVARYSRDGRLVISFRDMTPHGATRGDWVAWVGRYDDLVRGRPGQYRVRLMDNTDSWDCGYSGLESMPDGTLVATSYGHWDKDQPPYIVCIRFTLAELDRLASVPPPDAVAPSPAPR